MPLIIEPVPELVAQFEIIPDWHNGIIESNDLSGLYYTIFVPGEEDADYFPFTKSRSHSRAYTAISCHHLKFSGYRTPDLLLLHCRECCLIAMVCSLYEKSIAQYRAMPFV